MQSDLLLSVTAGDESDSSQDEWDLGGLRRAPQSAALAAAAAAPEQEQVRKLKEAINGGDAGLLGLLLDSGVDVDYRLSFGWTLLMCAVHSSHYEVAELLLDRGASANFSKARVDIW